MGRGGRLALLAQYDPPQVRNLQRSSPRKCLLAYVVETAQQAQDCLPRDPQLVSILLSSVFDTHFFFLFCSYNGFESALCLVDAPQRAPLPHGWLTVYVCLLLISSPRLASACSPRAPTVRRERHVNSRRSRLTRQPNALSELVNNDSGHISHDRESGGRRLLHCLIVLSASSRAQAYFLHECSTCTCCE